MAESTAALRTSLVGMITFAAAEEEILLADVHEDEDSGDARAWAARPTVAHVSGFRDEQVQRLTAIRTGVQPPDFAQIEHESDAVYRRYCAYDAPAVREWSRVSSRSLIDETGRCSAEDLLDPSRHPWLRGRHLWLQIVVRGFWHPLGHVGNYYVSHGRADRALSLHAHALATLLYLDAPSMALGMARYTLACTQAVLGHDDDAVATLTRAVGANPDLRAHARGDRDLAGLRARGRLDALLA